MSNSVLERSQGFFIKMMRLSNYNFHREDEWKDLMNRNEKLAIEVGKLRGDIRLLRKKNSALLIWKLKVDHSNFVEKTQTRDIGTQTEDFRSLIRFSDPYKTPLRVRPISKQNSAFQEGSMASAEPQIFEPSEEVFCRTLLTWRKCYWQF